MLWIRTGDHRTVPERVPLTDVAPTILARFGVPRPEHMKGHALPLGMPSNVGCKSNTERASRISEM